MPITEDYGSLQPGEWEKLKNYMRAIALRLTRVEGKGGSRTHYAPLDMNSNLITGGPNDQRTAEDSDYTTASYFNSQQAADQILDLLRDGGKAPLGQHLPSKVGIDKNPPNLNEHIPDIAKGVDGYISIAWRAATDDQSGVQAYNIWRGTSSDVTTHNLIHSHVSTLEPYYYTDMDADLVDGIVYYYSLSAIDNQGNESGRQITNPASLVFGDTVVPSGLTPSASANGMELLFGVLVSSNARSIFEAEIAIKKTTNTVTSLDISTPDFTQDGIVGTNNGAQFNYTATVFARYFYAWRVRNVIGWSSWTTGGASLGTSTDYVDTQNNMDTGPPQGWTVVLEDSVDDPSLASNQVRVRATRPTTNGNNLLAWVWQVKDSSTGSWLEIDSNTAPSVVYYDGSAIAHGITVGGSILKRTSGTGFGTASIGDMIMLDVRGGTFDDQYTQWGAIQQFQNSSGTPVAVGSATQILVQGFFRPQVTSDLRIKIVKAIWEWTTGGYLGLAGTGDQWIQGKIQDEFISPPLTLGNKTFSSLDVRVWFENHYCRSGSSTAGGSSTVSSSAASLSDGMKSYASSVTGKRIEIDNVNGLRAYDDSNVLWLQIPLAVAIGIIRFAGFKADLITGTLILEGRTDNDLLAIAMYTGQTSSRARVDLTPGAGAISRVELSSNDTVRATIDSAGLTMASGMDIGLASGRTVDGVDVSAHAVDSTDVHGITGSLFGSNQTNTLGSSGIIDTKTSGKLKAPRFATAGTAPPTMDDGEFVIWNNTANANYYFVHRDGSNYFYSKAFPNDATTE